MILILYVNDACLISPSLLDIKSKITSLQNDHKLTDEGPLNDCLGACFNRKSDGLAELTQLRKIRRVLDIVSLNQPDKYFKMHDTSASCILQTYMEKQPQVQRWNYLSEVGCLSYIQAMIWPDIKMSVQHCTWFNNATMKVHEEAVKRNCWGLQKNKEQGLIIKPDQSRGLECYMDANFTSS